MIEKRQSRYRWLMLGLSATTATLVATLPFSCMPALFKEISEDLNLTLVQVGSVWGIVSLSGVFVSVIAGILGDKFGVKRVLSITCFLIGITGALRGFADSFLTLMVTMFIYGLVRSILPINATRTIGLWFRGSNLGLAQGTIGMGMGMGLMLGPLLSATVLSPLLGGWRNVLFFYGGIAVIISIFWLIFGKEPDREQSPGGETGTVSIRETLSRLIKVKAIWLVGITLMFRFGSVLGMTGYMPLYLKNSGWSGANADNTLAAFFAVSTLFVIPLCSLSDKIGSRKMILLFALISTTISFSLIPFVDGVMIWVLMILAGMSMDGFMALIMALTLETEEIGQTSSGTALGLIFTIAMFGGILSPPIGNSFANINPGFPFIFWAILSLVSIVTISFVKETGRGEKRPPNSPEKSSLSWYDS